MLKEKQKVGTPFPVWLRLSVLAGVGLLLGWLAFHVQSGMQEETKQTTQAPAPEETSAASEMPTCGCGSGSGTETVMDKDGPEDNLPGDKDAPPIHEAKPPGKAPEGMVWIPGGTCWRGNNTPAHGDARPWHQVEVDGFWMDARTVTNEQFEKFVKATGYVTIAERIPKPEDFPEDVRPHLKPEMLVAGSVVFTPPNGPVPLKNHHIWWSYVKGANWRHPDGPKSDLKGREKHPVVQVAYDDALAYCKWAGKRLPTEAEFEFAARGGLDRNRYSWGNQFKPGGRWMCNIWQGKFPYQNTAADGYKATAPAGSFPPNKYGLYDMGGNVWQWCTDWYRFDYYRKLAAETQPVRNPQGPTDSFDPAERGVNKRVMRGGSYLCTDQYCTAYEVGARGKGAPDTGTNHLGFRCVKSK